MLRADTVLSRSLHLHSALMLSNMFGGRLKQATFRINYFAGALKVDMLYVFQLLWLYAIMTSPRTDIFSFQWRNQRGF